MKRFKTVVHTALCLAMVTGSALADQTRKVAPKTTTPPKVQAPVAKDAALSKGGILRGVALNTAAKPIANADVQIRFGSHVIARTKTRADGSFAVRGLRSGVHTVSVGQQANLYRLWTADVAPPAALAVVAVNGSEQTMRGQYMPAIDPMMLGVIATTAIIAGVIGKQVGDGDSRTFTTSP